jgi:hypothetical protein
MSCPGLIDAVEIMPSLQRPKKIGFMGDDGKRYYFLVKPHDDLRKDARLMDFNSMINKLLKGGSESRKRNLRESGSLPNSRCWKHVPLTLVRFMQTSVLTQSCR